MPALASAFPALPASFGSPQGNTPSRTVPPVPFASLPTANPATPPTLAATPLPVAPPQSTASRLPPTPLVPFPALPGLDPSVWAPPAMPPVPPLAGPTLTPHTPDLAAQLPPLTAALPPEGTDEDLFSALCPLIEEAVGRVLYAPAGGLHEYLEPMLRTTVRRAIAEMEGPEQPFHRPGFLDRLLWRLQALFTSRTYDEIIFEKTRRHRVEAALLLGKDALDLVSFASCDPGCHASPRRIQPLLREVLPRIRDEDGALQLSFELPDGSQALVREGKFTFLVVIARGTLDELATADVDFVQRRVEERHGARLQDPTAPLLKRVQPLLEDCLLVRSPAA